MRSLSNIFVDICLIVTGSVFTMCVAFAFSKVPIIKNILAYLGNNTVPIMLFHFMFFNVAYYILYLLGKAPYSYLQNFIPTQDVGNQYWWLISGISILICLFVWSVMKRIKIVRILFGLEKIL